MLNAERLLRLALRAGRLSYILVFAFGVQRSAFCVLRSALFNNNLVALPGNGCV